jgi:hypothetical protein
MFAALVFERDPLSYADVPQKMVEWVQIYGGWGAAGLLLWFIAYFSGGSRVVASTVPFWQVLVFVGGAIGAGVIYTLYAVLAVAAYQSAGPVPAARQRLLDQLLTIAGAFALVSVLLPFLLGVLKLRPRRIYAIAKVSFKEAVRRRILYVLFGLLILVCLFARWFVSSKPEDQTRTYVQMVYLAMTPELLFAAAAIAAFSIPTDIRQQTIHTILTKPVERFEVVLGRFFGYAALMTVALGVMTGLSLLFVLRSVDARDARESFKARDPLYGKLTFENTGDANKGTNVGKEWEYRSYITAPTGGQKPMTAIWSFPTLPQGVYDRLKKEQEERLELEKKAQDKGENNLTAVEKRRLDELRKYGDTVPCEFSFALYRTQTVGPREKMNKGLYCRFIFQTRSFVDSKLTADKIKEFEDEAKKSGRPSETIRQEMIEKYGYYEVPSMEIIENRTMSINVPGALFRNALEKDPLRKEPNSIQVLVQCNSVAQFVGVARYDLYVREDDSRGGYDTARFAGNFVKGAFGLWSKLMLVTGVAVALSTYLTGVVSMLVTLLLYLGGICREFIQTVSLAQNFGGGPARSLWHIGSRQSLGLAGLSDNPAARAADRVDIVFRWLIRRVLELIPDVQRFDLTDYVAEGFNISGPQLLISTLFLVVYYLLPCAVLAFYLIRWREVASAS